MGEVLDLRLVPAACGVWAVTLLGLYGGWSPAAVATGCAAAALAVAWRGRGRPGARAVLAAALLVVAAGTSISVRAHAVEHHPLQDSLGSAASLHVTLTDAPRALRGDSYGNHREGERALVPARLRAAEVDGRLREMRGRVVLLVPTAEWEHLVAGQEAALRGDLLPPRSGELTVAAVSTYSAPRTTGDVPVVQRVAEHLRQGLRDTAAEVLGPAAAGLLPGLVIGDVGGLPAEVEQDFETAGLTHLVAVSGANVAIVCGAVLLLARLVGCGPVVCAGVAALALCGFVVLCGPEPSVLRAAAMGAITLLALALGRERSTLPVLAASVLGLVLLAPNLAGEVGFALSVAATAALVVLAPAWSARLHERGVPVGLAEMLTVPAAAQLATAPLIAAVSGGISLIGVLANLLAGPAVPPATVLGVLATITAPGVQQVAELCVLLATPALGWIIGVAEHAADVPGALLPWPDGIFGGFLLAGTALLVLLALRFRRFRRVVLVAAVLAACLVPVRSVVSPWPPGGWSAVVCDVGQGDATVLATGRPGEVVLVDTGPDAEAVTGCLRRLGVDRVALLVLSHLHADHVGGVDGVLAELPVGGVAVGPHREPAWAMREVAEHARRNGTPVLSAETGRSLRWPALTLDVLGPTGSLTRASGEEAANDASVVLRARTPAGSVLLTGDVEVRGQQQLLWSGTDLSADVLKVPHHGSRTSLPGFVAAVDPRVALISVGADNDYGHPHGRLLGMLASVPEVLRTDEDGDIAVLAGRRGPSTAAAEDALLPAW
ncbi:DNA internalization-related competence protein ComEC/Rec2 [Bounagaea algeriensis]